MVVLDAIGLAMASADALINLFNAWKSRQDAHGQIPELLKSSNDRVQRIKGIISKYDGYLKEIGPSKAAIPLSGLPEEVFARVNSDFNAILKSFLDLEETLKSRSTFGKWYSSPGALLKVSSILGILNPLENYLSSMGLMAYAQEQISFQVSSQFSEISCKLQSLSENQDPDLKNRLMKMERQVQAMFDWLGFKMNVIPLESAKEQELCDIQVTEVSDEEVSDEEALLDQSQESFHLEGYLKLPKETREQFDVLCRSGVSKESLEDLGESIRKLWSAWELNEDDVTVNAKVELGIGHFSEVYKGTLLRAGPKGSHDGEFMPVAVKRLRVDRDDIPHRQALFMREIFLQMDMDHPCLLKTYGGFWPEENQNGSDESRFILPYMVMEKMSFNLETAVRNGNLKNNDIRMRVGLDVARGIAYLHARRVVHRDIKPGNVLLRFFSGKVTDVKVSDFGISRRVQKVNEVLIYYESRNAPGTILYMPPEVIANPSHCKSHRSWDVWSYGVLLCYMCHPDLTEIVFKTENREMAARNGELAKAFQKVASDIEHQLLKLIAVSCLNHSESSRPKMNEVVSILRGTVKPEYLAAPSAEEPASSQIAPDDAILDLNADSKSISSRATTGTASDTEKSGCCGTLFRKCPKLKFRLPHLSIYTEENDWPCGVPPLEPFEPLAPLQAALYRCLSCQSSPVDICSALINYASCSASFPEWCSANEILVLAVCNGDIRRSTDYQGVIAYWYNNLYLALKEIQLTSREDLIAAVQYLRAGVRMELSEDYDSIRSALSLSVPFDVERRALHLAGVQIANNFIDVERPLDALKESCKRYSKFSTYSHCVGIALQISAIISSYQEDDYFANEAGDLMFGLGNYLAVARSSLGHSILERAVQALSDQVLATMTSEELLCLGVAVSPSGLNLEQWRELFSSNLQSDVRDRRLTPRSQFRMAVYGVIALGRLSSTNRRNTSDSAHSSASSGWLPVAPRRKQDF